MAILRYGRSAVDWLMKFEGKRFITDDRGVPLRVQSVTGNGRCLGIAARATTGHAAGYDYARDVVHVCDDLGLIKSGTPPIEGLRLWLGGPGHIAQVFGVGRKVICNVGPIIAVEDIDHWSSLNYVGWVYPWDIPGWGPDPRKPVAPAVPFLSYKDIQAGSSNDSVDILEHALVGEKLLAQSDGVWRTRNRDGSKGDDLIAWARAKQRYGGPKRDAGRTMGQLARKYGFHWSS